MSFSKVFSSTATSSVLQISVNPVEEHSGLGRRLTASLPEYHLNLDYRKGFRLHRHLSALYLPARRLRLKDFQWEMQDCLLPTAVGFDLDRLYGNYDRGPADDIVRKRMDGVRAVLESVAQPAFICLARSQSPRSYIPAVAVDLVQNAALGLILEVWG